MRVNYFIAGSIILIPIAAIYFAIQQNRKDSKAIEQAEFKVESCYRMNSDSADHAIKIINIVGKNAYVEKTWTKKRGWDDEAISERTAYFYTEIKCPKQRN